jgi:WD40 repeat protein
MNKQEQPQSKRVNVGPGIYVMFVIGGTMLLLGGLAAVHYTITLRHLVDEGASLIFSYLVVVFPLVAIGGILFLIGLIRLVKQMPKGSGIIASLVGVGLIVGLPVIGGVIPQSPLFPGPYPLFTYHGNGAVVAWSPDGRRIASGSWDNTVQVWNAADGRNVYTYRGHSAPVTAVAWSPDGKRIASGAWDDTVQVWNSTTVWDSTTGSMYVTYRGHSSAVRSVAWSPDGKFIASGDDGTVQVWKAP